MEAVLRRGLLALWGIWFGVVTLSNTGDLLKTLSLLPESFGFTSNNFELVSRATGLGRGVNLFLFTGIIVWETAAVGAFVWAAWKRPRSLLPFAVAMFLFQAFMIGDELSRTYGPQGMHIRLFVALGATLLVTRLGADPEGR